MAEDDEESFFGGLYEDGHWAWDDDSGELAFFRDVPVTTVEAIQKPMKAPTGVVEFRDDVDLIEQIRFRRRYQRKVKPGEADIITLQDVKDLAIYTAPLSLLSPMLIKMLHIPTTERFLRALILCIGYYLQVKDTMASRVSELETKVRTPDCDIIENEFRENLSDLRLLVAKEYTIMLIGGCDTKNYHHMGPAKKRQSLSDKDARFIETLLRMSVQIVWLALGRRSFHQIEMEIHRLFKSETFNLVEHNLKTGYIAKMSSCERKVLLGECVRQDKKLKICSPLMNEVFCHRDMDFRLTGLGVIGYKKLSKRLQFLWIAIGAKEDEMVGTNVVLGIIGMPRSLFDTMLRPIPQVSEKSKMGTSSIRSTQSSYSASSSSIKKSALAMQRLYPKIVIPEKCANDTYLPVSFPDEPAIGLNVNEVQRFRWLNRLAKLTQPLKVILRQKK